MSLFATDSALIAPPKHVPAALPVAVPAAAPSVVHTAAANRTPVPHAAPQASPSSVVDADAAWSNILPHLVGAAIARGHVRTAAMMHELAMGRLSETDAGAESARVALDRCAAVDAVMQRRQLRGEAVVVPSLSEVQPGEPRFLVGIEWGEMSHPDVQAFVQGELTDGTQVELRNFLDESVREGDLFVDLDPGAGVGALTVLSHSAGVSVQAFTGDALLCAMLQRNVVAPGFTERARVTHGALSSPAMAPMPGRTIVHVGGTSMITLSAMLPSWSARAVALAWRTGSAEGSAERTAHAFEAAGFPSFVLAMRGDALELVPLHAAPGAEYAFALSAGFMTSLEGNG